MAEPRSREGGVVVGGQRRQQVVRERAGSQRPGRVSGPGAESHGRGPEGAGADSSKMAAETETRRGGGTSRGAMATEGRASWPLGGAHGKGPAPRAAVCGSGWLISHGGSEPKGTRGSRAKGRQQEQAGKAADAARRGQRGRGARRGQASQKGRAGEGQAEKEGGRTGRDRRSRERGDSREERRTQRADAKQGKGRRRGESDRASRDEQ